MIPTLLLGMKSKALEHGLIGDLPVHLRPSKVGITTVFPPVWREMSSCAPSWGQWNLNLINRAVTLIPLSSVPPCGAGSWQGHWHTVTETQGSYSKTFQRFCPSKYAAHSCHICHCRTLLLFVNLVLHHLLLVSLDIVCFWEEVLTLACSQVLNCPSFNV